MDGKKFLKATLISSLIVNYLVCCLGASVASNAEHVKIVIVGAGASGYAAGCRLLDHNFTDFVVLEAADRIGGRVHSIPFGRDKIDMGGQWIHGEIGNIVNEMAVKYDLVYKPTSIMDNWTTYQSDGKYFDPSYFAKVLEFYESVNSEDTTNVTINRGEYITKRFWETFNHTVEENKITRSEATGFLKLIEQVDNAMEASPSWLETSAHSSYVDYEGEFNVVWKSGGYSTLFDLLSKKIPNPNNQLKIDDKIRLGKEVTRVDWSGDVVTVSCADGSQFTADRVLTTVSLNVLKATANQIFHPALPQPNTNAITGLGMGTVNKIYLEFPYRWWEPSTGGIFFIWRPEDIEQVPQELKWTTGVYGFNVPNNFPLNLLCGWVTGRDAEVMETLPEEVVKEEVMKLLRRFAGPSVHVPDAVSIRRTKWFSNPFTRGSYSHRTVASDLVNVWPKDLAQPVRNAAGNTVLQFAGEATNQEHHSTVHGAVETGFREADIILSSLNLSVSE